MKKKSMIVLATTLTLCTILWIFRDPIIDALPIDQSGWVDRAGIRMYLDEDGEPVTGWQKIGTARYYFDSNGQSVTGWLELDGQTFFLNSAGIVHTGWLEIRDNIYCFAEDGTMISGWAEKDGYRYYLGTDGKPKTGWLVLEDGTYYLNHIGIMQVGWLELETGTYYLDQAGRLYSGWLDQGNKRFYLNEDGTLHTGWLKIDDKTYYLNEQGNPVQGKLLIEDQTHYFSSTGEQILLVNRWNMVPENYEVELNKLPDGPMIAAECYAPLLQMIEDCVASGSHPIISNANRSKADQQFLFTQIFEQWRSKGYTDSDAYARTMRQVATPGTSEHELGLAVDIDNKDSIGNDCHDWLHEHCWEYGFIVRYPANAAHITGIMYEPWHYRYVGVELATELRESGLCLEEYLDKLTNDGTTCGNPDALK